MITVLGSSGFIGSHLVRYLERNNINFFAPQSFHEFVARDLGTVIYCIGMIQDFHKKPLEAVEAHVGYLARVLEQCRFESLVYLSSTIVYRYGNRAIAREDDPLVVYPLDPRDIYAISKIMGEALLLTYGPQCKVIRLTNVYGNNFSSNSFLVSLLKDAVGHKEVVLQTSLNSQRDYLSVEDAVAMVATIAQKGEHPIYNLASGINVSHGEIIAALAQLTHCSWRVAEQAKVLDSYEIDITRIKQEFNFSPRLFLNDLPMLVALYKKTMHQDSRRGNSFDVKEIY